jgi:predicted RNA-binding Zn-ribbon protein involved in translation (DUF1610 family)
MKVINCPKCNEEVTIDIAKCVDEEGEVHVCQNCGMLFRYVDY